MRFSRRLFSVGMVGLLGVVAAGGCGGGGGDNKSPDPTSTPQAPGSVHLTVQWPSRTGKLVPLAANSVVVIFEDSKHKELTRATAVRPDDNASTGDVRFSPVPVGSYFVNATAYPQADATGTVQGQATVPVSVTTGAETTLDISVASTITSLTLASAPGTTSDGGQTIVLTPTARNAAEAVVLTHPNQFTWQSSDTSIATVDAKGIVTATGAGQVTITVRDSESGTTTQATVTTNVTAQ